MIDLIMQLAGGALGGNAAGKAMKENSMGTMLNTVVGLLGGFGGSKLLAMVPALAGMLGGGGAEGMDIGAMVGGLLGGGAGGGILTAVVGMIKNAMAK